MEVYYGVVESRADPLKLGRCKVRVIGVHTEDTKVLPTADLPWAIPMMPIFSASTSGIGYSPTGLVEGTWVAVIFRDGDSLQEPIILGSFFGMPENNQVQSEEENTTPSAYNHSADFYDYSAKVENLNQITPGELGKTTQSSSANSTSNSNILKQAESYSKVTNKETGKSEYSIGAFTAKMESGGNVGEINQKDVNGAAYGKYQFHSGDLSNGNVPKNSTLMQYINQSEYKDEFTGLRPGTDEFNAKWREIAGREPKEFEASQRDFMVSTQYSYMSNKLAKNGVDLSGRGDGVQEMIFSTSTQYGKKSEVILDALEGKNVDGMTDNEIIETVTAHKIATVDKHFPSASQSVRESCKKRWATEGQAYKTLNGDNTAQSQNLYNAKKKEAGIDAAESTLSATQKETIKNTKISQSGVSVPRTISQNAGDGFRDPFNVYPKKDWLGESETSRLSRNENTEKSIVQKKKQSLCKGVGTAGGGSWNEPQSPFAPQYPLNHVFQSESGHVREYDDTPNAERVHIYHRKGSFIEFHPNGDVVYKDTNNKYEVTINDRNVYVGGTCNLTVAGDANIYSKGSARLMSEGNIEIKARGNLDINAGGKVSIVAGGMAEFGAVGRLAIGGSRVDLNGKWKPSSPDFDVVNGAQIDLADIEKNEAHIETLGEGVTATATVPETGTFNENVDPPEEKEKEETEKNEECPGAENITCSSQISTYYKLADVTTSCAFSYEICAQKGLTICDIFENLSAAAKNVADNLYKHYGGEFIITSGFRRGTGNSQHCKGEALDFQFNGIGKGDVLELAKKCDEICSFLPSFDQMILENWKNHKRPVLHISYKRNGSNRCQKLYSTSSTSYASVGTSFYNFIKGNK